jgi:thiamine biosynthesis lipoprotein ApbE
MRQSAALADALTTAGMIMPIDKIKNISRDYSDISVMILTNMQNGKGASLIKMGQWTGSD